MAPDEHFVVPDDVLVAYRAAGVRGRGLRDEWAKRRDALRDAEPGLAEDYAACIEGRGVEGWESKLPELVARRRRARDPAGVLGHARRDHRRRARARRRRCRPHRQHGHEAARGRGRHRHPRLPGSPDPLRHPRARHGRGHERDVRRRAAALRRDLLRVQRLHARRGAGRRALRLQGRVRLVARLDRGRRGRADPPAGRAARGDARDARHPGDPPGRRERDGRGVARPHRRRRADRDHPQPPEGPGARGDRGAGRAGRRPRRVRARRRGARRSGHRARRHRVRGAALRRARTRR